jgi:bacterial/archaeal transporter family-2 protein
MLAPMDKLAVASAAAIGAGALIALQAPINATLGGSIGTVAAASVNFVVGAVILVVLTIVFAGGFGSLSGAGELPWYYTLGGGAVGAAFVIVAIITVPTLGAGGVTAATLAGQLAASLVIDRLGILGLAEREITVGRVAGVAILLLGTYLVVR